MVHQFEYMDQVWKSLSNLDPRDPGGFYKKNNDNNNNNNNKKRTPLSVNKPFVRTFVTQILIWGYLGHRGQRLIFTKNTINRFMLHSKTVIHIYKLETLYLCCGLQVHRGSFEIIGFESLF